MQVNQGAAMEFVVNPAPGINVNIAAGPSARAVQAQIDQLVIDGDSSVEAAQARVNAGGAVYGTLKARLDASDAALRPVTAGGTGGGDAATARGNLGAAAASHNHAAGDVTTGVLPAERGGTGVASLAALLSALDLTVMSTTTPAAEAAIASITEFRLRKVGKVVIFMMQYTGTMAAASLTENAIIPAAYRPLSTAGIALNVFVGNNTTVATAYMNHAGFLNLRLSASATAALISGTWETE